MGHAAPDDDLRGADNFLHVLLHGGHGENSGHGGKSEKIRRLRTRNQTRAADGGLYRPRADAADAGGLGVPVVYRGTAESDSRSDAHSGSVFRRDGAANRGQRRTSHNETNRSDGRYAALRRLHEIIFRRNCNAAFTDGTSWCRKRYAGGRTRKKIFNPANFDGRHVPRGGQGRH